MTNSTTKDIQVLSALETAELVRSGQVSPRETVEAAIERIEETDPAINSVVFKGYEDARARAAALEKRILRGEQAGALAGVPTVTKDTFSAKQGWPTSSGLSALKNRLAGKSTNFPRRVEAADGILIGTTNSAVFGFRGTTDSKAFGPTHNPFNVDYNAGGSSGGSAAAVAAGLVPLAGATDVGGSIRIPSAWCGTFGFQPSPGLAPFTPAPNLFGPSPYFFEGPITRSVADSALAMDVLQGYDPSDPAALSNRVNFGAALDKGIRGKRVGFTPDFGIFPVEDEVQRVVENASRVFRDLGAEVVDVDPMIPYTQRQLSDVWSRLTAIGTFGSITALKEEGIDLRKICPEELPEAMMHWVDVAATMSMEQLLSDNRVRSVVFNCFTRAFSDLDFVVSPTVACMPARNSDDGFTQGPTSINGEDIDPLIGWCMTYLTNFTGNPSASIPAGMVRGLPVGLQVMGRRHADADVMAASAAFEAAAPWQTMYDALT